MSEQPYKMSLSFTKKFKMIIAKMLQWILCLVAEVHAEYFTTLCDIKSVQIGLGSNFKSSSALDRCVWS